jgi:pimeloyl-ACP methyl ester carboxylesterase
MSEIVRIEAAGRSLAIEYMYVGSDLPNAPLIIFLHEGLGSVAMWRDFPQALCDAAGARGLVYSRPGYGRSTPRAADEHWGVEFMHAQAGDVLPALLRALHVDRPAWLFGHSDGGSIALIHAAMLPTEIAGVIVVAPHLFVEEISVTSIAKTRDAYLTTTLKTKLARFHDDVDSAFWGWNDIWLNPAFRQWNIEALLPQITCPVLAVQGIDDEYGTMVQIDRIADALPQAQLLKLEHCGHSPHRDQAAAVIAAAQKFIAATHD